MLGITPRPDIGQERFTSGGFGERELSAAPGLGIVVREQAIAGRKNQLAVKTHADVVIPRADEAELTGFGRAHLTTVHHTPTTGLAHPLIFGLTGIAHLIGDGSVTRSGRRKIET